MYVMKLVGELEGATIKIEALDTSGYSEYESIWYCTVEREDIGFRETKEFYTLEKYWREEEGGPYLGHGDSLHEMYEWFVCNAKKSAQVANDGDSEDCGTLGR